MKLISRPPISYYGGKQRMAHNIVPLIPQHTVYVEPFAGGAAVLFKKPWPKVTNTHNYREVINDNKIDLINFYRTLRDPVLGPKLCDRLALTTYSRAVHKTRKQDFLDPVERAASFYCDIQMSFANVQGAGWRTGVFGVNHAATWANKVSNLSEYIDRMSSIHIECDDAISVIKRWDSPQTFFYCDPPYPNAHQGHYKGYTQEDFNLLIETLNDAQGSFLLSNYNQPGVPDTWERFEFASRATSKKCGSIATRGKKAVRLKSERVEILWRRFNKYPVRPEIQKLYDSGAFDCFAKSGLKSVYDTQMKFPAEF